MAYTISPMSSLVEADMRNTCTIYKITMSGDEPVYDSYGQPVFATGVTSKCTISQYLKRNIISSGDVQTDTGTIIMLPASTYFTVRDTIEYEGSEGPLTGQVILGRDSMGYVTHISVVIA